MALTANYMKQRADFNWSELKEYLTLFVEAEVDRWMTDPDNEYSEQYARVNTVENLHESIIIIFGDLEKPTDNDRQLLLDFFNKCERENAK